MTPVELASSNGWRKQSEKRVALEDKAEEAGPGTVCSSCSRTHLRPPPLPPLPPLSHRVPGSTCILLIIYHFRVIVYPYTLAAFFSLALRNNMIVKQNTTTEPSSSDGDAVAGPGRSRRRPRRAQCSTSRRTTRETRSWCRFRGWPGAAAPRPLWRARAPGGRGVATMRSRARTGTDDVRRSRRARWRRRRRRRRALVFILPHAVGTCSGQHESGGRTCSDDVGAGWRATVGT